MIVVIVQELATTQCAWALVRDTLGSHHHALSQDILVRLDEAFHWGSVILSDLDEELLACTKTPVASGEYSFRQRTRLVWNEKKLRIHQDRIRGQVMSMSLLISVLRLLSTSVCSIVPSRLSINSTNTDTLSLLDDPIYNPLCIDDDLFTSVVYKRNYRSRAYGGKNECSARTVEPNVAELGGQPDHTEPAFVEVEALDASSVSRSACPYLNSRSDHLAAAHVIVSESESNIDHDYLHPDSAPECKSTDIVLSSTRNAIKDNDMDVSPSILMVMSGYSCHEMELMFLDACRHGIVRLVCELLQLGVSVHSRVKEGNGLSDRPAAIHLAAKHSQPEVALTLLQHGALVNDRYHGTRRPLHEAAAAGDYTMTTLLLEHGARNGLQDNQGSEPLHLACQSGARPVAELLLDGGAWINSNDHSFYQPLHCAAQYCDDPLLASLLIDVGSDLEAMTSRGYTALQIACICNNIPVLEVLLSRGASASAPSWGITPLVLAVLYGHYCVARFLLENGVQTESCDPRSRQRIIHLIAKGLSQKPKDFQASERDWLELFLKHGADINAQDAKGNTPLHVSLNARSSNTTFRSRCSMVKHLLMHGAHTDIPNHQGHYPLSLAAKSLDLGLFRLVLAASAQKLSDMQLIIVERDIRLKKTDENSGISKEMIAALCLSRLGNRLDPRHHPTASHDLFEEARMLSPHHPPPSAYTRKDLPPFIPHIPTSSAHNRKPTATQLAAAPIKTTSPIQREEITHQESPQDKDAYDSTICACDE
ncbi:MAG: hypothetical protein Q9222_004163 [Ikaeria aurantiellina]